MPVVCGPPASGKSTLAAELHRRTGLPVLSSDVRPVPRASRDGVLARAGARGNDPGAISDATADVTRRWWSGWCPLDEISPDRHPIVRADRDAATIAEDVERRLDEVGP